MKSALALTLIVTLMTPSMSLASTETLQSWSKAHNWEPGSEVTVRMASSDLRRRYFISTDDTGMMLLNVSDVALPPGVASSMRQVIVKHPDYFPLRDGITVKFDDRASLATDGLFAAGQKVAEYDQVIERISRSDVEAGVVLLDVKKGMPAGKQLLITLGILAISPGVIYAIACARGCR